MRLWPWKKRRAEIELSAYLDGELDVQEAAELGEHLVFDPDFKTVREVYRKVSALVDAALAPPRIPDSAAFADHLVEALGQEPREAPLPLRPTGRRWHPALWASIGILVTAGVTFAGLRRRGLV